MSLATARRYAKALFELALQENSIVPVREGLEKTDSIIQTQTEIQDVCRNPLYNLDEKKRVLSSLSNRIGSPPLLIRFIDLLIRKNRLRQLPEITNVFARMADEARGLEHVRVQMAKQMSKEQESAFKEKLETLLNRNVDMSVEVDPSLIGGMIVYAGSRVYDGSLKGQLRELGRELSE